jgi:two-component system sensor histidine kinase/response regulator
MGDKAMTGMQPTILAIDDTPANLLTLGAALEADFDLRIATSGAAGLELAAELTPSLILLDIMMPEMDGYETCRRLKADPLLCNIPVIFVTAASEPGAENSGLALGAADFITKPINVAVARHRICNLIEREQLRTEVEAQRDQLEQLVQARTEGLSIALEAADVANQTKTVFLRNMSHELRTSMAAILGMAELAARRATDPKQIAQLGKLKGAAATLQTLISDLVDTTELQSNRLSLTSGNFTLRAVVDKIRELFGDAAAKNGIALDLGAEAALLDLPVLGDAIRLEQVLQGLIGNALKFTQHGSISATIQRVEEHAHHILIRVEVRDTGIGIAQADQLRIFNLFEQADGSLTRRFGGTGLGLALCKQIIALMGGAMGVESEPGRGSRFWFTVQLRKLG